MHNNRPTHTDKRTHFRYIVFFQTMLSVYFWNLEHHSFRALKLEHQIIIAGSNKGKKRTKRRNDPIDPAAHKWTIAQGE